MATRKRPARKSKSKSKKTPAKQPRAKAKRPAAKKARKPAPRSTPKKPAPRTDVTAEPTMQVSIEVTQQLTFGEILGDIEEVQAIDRLAEED